MLLLRHCSPTLWHIRGSQHYHSSILFPRAQFLASKFKMTRDSTTTTTAVSLPLLYYFYHYSSDCLLSIYCVRHWEVCFFVYLLITYSIKEVPLFPPFLRNQDGCFGKLNDLSKAIQLESDRLGPQIHTASLQRWCYYSPLF